MTKERNVDVWVAVGIVPNPHNDANLGCLAMPDTLTNDRRELAPGIRPSN